MPKTDAGTLIMRTSPASSSRTTHGTTLAYPSESGFPSVAPFALDLDDYAEPARNSDAFGTNRRNRTTTDAAIGRSTTRTSFFAGLCSGLMTLSVGIAIGFIAFTTDEGADVGTIARSRHAVAHVASRLHVDALEMAEQKAEQKAVPKKHAHRTVRKASTDVATEAAPEPSETE